MFSLKSALMSLKRLTIPGIIIHEISHRLMCDIYQIPVYQVSYFSFKKSTSSFVLHKKIENLKVAYRVAMAPLFINSLVAMLLTIPFGTVVYCNTTTELSLNNNIFLTALNFVIMWVGLSAGFQAIPTNQDTKEFMSLLRPQDDIFTMQCIVFFINLANLPWIGIFIRMVYASLLTVILPAIMFSCWL